jgi:ACR3 family arsenite efflux pump ArsB
MKSAIAIGLVVMMWPVLTKVQYETLPKIFTSRKIWIQIGLSMFLNWIIGPFVMLGLAWATLPDLPTYRTGVIMVGIARCIAMVMIWNQLARGDMDYCAILVVVNSILQIVLYSPYSVLFINVVGGDHSFIHLSYREVAISVLIVCVASASLRESSLMYRVHYSTSVSLWWRVSSPDMEFGISRAKLSSKLDSYPFSRRCP